jgi:hypothetical protein
MERMIDRAEDRESDTDSTYQKQLDTLQDWLQPVIFALVTQVERELGAGTGRLKLATVLKEVIALLPDAIKPLISTEWITARIEDALAKAKTVLAENPKLVEK